MSRILHLSSAMQQFPINLFEPCHLAAALAAGSWRISCSCSRCVQYFASRSDPARNLHALAVCGQCLQQL